MKRSTGRVALKSTVGVSLVGLVLAAAAGCSATHDASESDDSFVVPSGFSPVQVDLVTLSPAAFAKTREGILSATKVRRLHQGKPSKPGTREFIEGRQLIETTFGAHYTDGMRVNTSANPGAWVDVKPIGAQSVVGKVRADGGIVAFEGAWGPKVSAVYGATERNVEEFLSIPTEADVPTVSYELALGPELDRIVPDLNRLWAYDKSGDNVMVVEPPVAIDAQGKRVEGTWRLEQLGSKLRITADLSFKGLEFPVLLDPNFEAPRWAKGDTVLGGHTAPTARGGQFATYHVSSGCVLIWGGIGSGPGFASLADAYGRCSGSWENITQAGNIPAARSMGAMAYSPTDDAVYLFGGYDGIDGAQNDFYKGVLSGSAGARTLTWTKLFSTSGTATTRPSRRYGAGTAWDGTRVIVFGGITSPTGTVARDTWGYDSGTNTWTQLCTSCLTTTSGRINFATNMLGTTASPTVYLFGGVTASTTGSASASGAANDVRTWDATGFAWNKVTSIGNSLTPADDGASTPVAPSNRYSAWAGRTPSGRFMVGSGIDSSGTRVDDNWHVSVTGTSQRWGRVPGTTPGYPGFRELATATYDEGRSELLVFGGFVDDTTTTDVPSLYKGREDNLTVKVKCNSIAGGSGCDAVGDTYTLTATLSLTGVSGVDLGQIYFIDNGGGSGSSYSAIGGACGTAAAPITATGTSVTYTATCTVAYNGSSTRTFGARARDARLIGAPDGLGTDCSSTPTETTPRCLPATAYSGAMSCRVTSSSPAGTSTRTCNTNQ